MCTFKGINVKNILGLKKIAIAVCLIAMLVGGFLIHALAGLSARPVVFANPPEFVERYAAELDHSDPSRLLQEPETSSEHVGESEFADLTAGLSEAEVQVFNVLMDGTSPDVLPRLFAHPDKVQRVKVASAFASVNIRFSHNDESGYPEKRVLFWVELEEHLPDIQNALSEALIATAEEGTRTRIPYTLAWMPNQNHETVELLAWAAQHHPDPWVRRFCVYFVIEFGGDEELAGPLLRNRIHDPSYTVRKEVLKLRFNRFIRAFGAAEDA